MLKTIFYQSNQDLLDNLAVGTADLIVCPSPAVADNLRSLVPHLNVVTISKWTSDHLKELKLKKVRKADLMLKLAGFWRTYFPDESIALFDEAFEHFTELRSFTLDLGLLSEFFKELDPKIEKSIFIFWAYVQEENLIDEHLAYQKIVDSALHSSFSFVGFKHLSGVQIDMLKALGENFEVDVCLPQAVYRDSLANDWVRWLPIEANVDLEISEEFKPRLKTVYIPKGKTNIALKEFLKQQSGHDLLFVTTGMGLNTIQEAQSKHSFFKVNEDIFSVETEKVFLDLKSKIEQTSLSLEEANLYFQSEKSLTLAKLEVKKFKILELYEEAMASYGEFQKKLDHFALEIITKIVLLNSPRVSLVALEQNEQRRFLDLGSIAFHHSEHPVALYASSSFSGINTSEKILSEAMTKALKAIGPIKRTGLEFLFYKYELTALMEEESSFLLVEDELLDSNLSWREILKNVELENYDLHLSFEIKKLKEYLAPKVKKGPYLIERFSATRMQSYLDCPKGYYFKNIEKINPRPEERESLGPDELGQLEHKIIEEYFKDKKNWKAVNLKIHQELCVDKFKKYLSEKKLSLSESQWAGSLNEIMHYSLNGIEYLCEFIQNNEVESISMEVSLPKNKWNISGSIDCLVELKNQSVHLLDFKRSEASIGSKSETADFHKIQLWTYLVVLASSGVSVERYGYLNLSETESSLFFPDSKGNGSVNDELLSLAAQKIETTIEAMKKEEVFRENPRNANVCMYCPVSLFCLKGVNVE